MRLSVPLDNLSSRTKQLLVGSIAAITIVFAGASNISHAQHDHYDQLPDLGSTAARYLSDADSEKLGLAFIRQSRARLPYVSDPELVQYINDLGQTLLAVSEHADRDYNFHLIKNDIINAFAVPGGQIAIHTGILTKSESESELASVVAHEIAHITQRHIARNIENSRFDSILALGALLAAAAAGGAEGAQAGVALASASSLDRRLRYSRAYESEADSLGIRLLSRAGFNPEAMPTFFKRLLDDSRLSESYAPEFLRSHPLTIKRITESAERVRAYPPAKEQNENRFRLMQAKATALYTKRISLVSSQYKQKIDDGDTSLATRYGYGILLSRNNEYDKARTVFESLLKDYPGNVSVQLIRADNELEAKNIDDGLQIFKNLYEEQVKHGNHMTGLYYANALILTDNHSDAIPILRSAISKNRSEPLNYLLISRAYGEVGEKVRSFDNSGEFHYLRGNYAFALKQFAKAEFLSKSQYDKARLQARMEDVQKEIAALKRL